MHGQGLSPADLLRPLHSKRGCTCSPILGPRHSHQNCHSTSSQAIDKRNKSVCYQARIIRTSFTLSIAISLPESTRLVPPGMKPGRRLIIETCMEPLGLLNLVVHQNWAVCHMAHPLHAWQRRARTHYKLYHASTQHWHTNTRNAKSLGAAHQHDGSRNKKVAKHTEALRPACGLHGSGFDQRSKCSCP